MRSFNLPRMVVTLAAFVWLVAGLMLIATLGASHSAQAQGLVPRDNPFMDSVSDSRIGASRLQPTDASDTLPVDQSLTTITARQYYLTKASFAGNYILPLNPFYPGACADGYHFASLWEIFDTSNLIYNSSLGHTRQDAGYGPPAYVFGWVRTGFGVAGSGGPGVANCRAWSSGSSTDQGTLAFLSSDWGSISYPLFSISPWQANTGACYLQNRVWCVQN